jgi:hypothetical protein
MRPYHHGVVRQWRRGDLHVVLGIAHTRGLDVPQLLFRRWSAPFEWT